MTSAKEKRIQPVKKCGDKMWSVTPTHRYRSFEITFTDFDHHTRQPLTDVFKEQTKAIALPHKKYKMNKNIAQLFMTGKEGLM